ncbi:MAG: hypothetical protein PCFJNLEI_02456 [Verrucomicrobiae bacterium]|nr:hypothetical protein [Verrucomicrobiae bacterium]
MANEPHQESDPKLDALLRHTLPTVSRPDEAHYEYDELNRLAKDRREKGAAWEMPPHLSRCSLCLEAFQAILEGVATVSADTLKRFGAIRSSDAKIVAFPWPMVWRVAAVVAVLFAVFVFLTPTKPARVSDGAVALPDGKLLPTGTPIPRGVTVTATDTVSASFADGSLVELTKDTQVSFGVASVTLTAGKLVASVTKQTAGKPFVVKTALGEVVVVGTKFSVASTTEDVEVYESMAGQTHQRITVVQAIRVSVVEGVVRVKRHNEQVNVTANQTAVLRESEPGIEVK